MTRLVRSRFFLVSPWPLAAATALLILIVVIFTLNNMKREKELMTSAMLQKGATLMRVVGSGARSAYLADMRHGVWTVGTWDEYVLRVINHLSEDPEVLFMMVFDDGNRVVAHTQSNKIGSIVENLPVLPETGNDPASERFRLVYRIVTDEHLAHSIQKLSSADL